jgi:hypothetical protein
MGLFDALLDNLNPQRVYDRRVAGWQERQQGLLGSVGQPLLGPGPTEMGNGTGLLGGQITPMQYAQQTMLNPLYKDQGLSMINSLSGQQAQMDRLRYGMENISATDQARLDQQQQQFAQQQALAQSQRVGGYSDLNQYGQALDRHQTNFEQEVTPVRSAMEQWQAYDDTYKAKGGRLQDFTGIDDIQSLVALNKILKPNEAMMQDDITNIQQAASYLGLGETIVSKLTGGSAVLDLGTRKAIKDAIDRMSKRKFEQYTEIRKRYDTMGQQQGFGGSKYMRPEMKYDPGEAPRAAQQRSLNNMPSDVQPVRTGGRGRNR